MKTGKKKTGGIGNGKPNSNTNSGDSEDEFNITPGGTKTRKKKTKGGLGDN